LFQFYPSGTFVFVPGEANRQTRGRREEGTDDEMHKEETAQMNHKTAVESSANYPLKKPARKSKINSFYFFPWKNCIFRIQEEAEEAQSEKKIAEMSKRLTSN
jgi:hypothetical protein